MPCLRCTARHLPANAHLTASCDSSADLPRRFDDDNDASEDNDNALVTRRESDSENVNADEPRTIRVAERILVA